MNRVARIGLLGGILLFIGGCSKQDDITPGAVEEAQISVVEFEYSLLPTGERILTGALRNQSKKPISGAQVQVSLFDRSNRRIGTMSFVVRDVGPGERKPFRQPVNEVEEVQGARVRNIIVL